MKEEEKVWIASVALGKNYDYETLEYSDYLYDKKEFADEIWELVNAGRENGTKWFRETYSKYKLYPGI